MPQTSNLREITAQLRTRNARLFVWLLEAVNYELLHGLGSVYAIVCAASLCVASPYFLLLANSLLILRLKRKDFRWYQDLTRRHRRLRRCLLRAIRHQTALARRVYLEEVLAEADFVRERVGRHYFEYAGVAVGVYVLNFLGGHLPEVAREAKDYTDTLWSWHWLVETKVPK